MVEKQKFYSTNLLIVKKILIIVEKMFRKKNQIKIYPNLSSDCRRIALYLTAIVTDFIKLLATTPFTMITRMSIIAPYVNFSLRDFSYVPSYEDTRFLIFYLNGRSPMAISL